MSSIIQNRLEWMLVTGYKTTVEYRKKHRETPRRPTYVKGTVRYTEVVSVPMSKESKEKLDALSERIAVARTVICRDAIEFYIGMAEQEGLLSVQAPRLRSRKKPKSEDTKYKDALHSRTYRKRKKVEKLEETK